MKKNIIVILLVLFNGLSYAQHYDTTKLDIGIKSAIYLNSINFLGSSKDSFCTFIQIPIRYAEIYSHGFSSKLKFFRIDSLYQQLGNKKHLFETSCPIPFIVGFDISNSIIYKLRGFDDNDLIALLGNKWPSKKARQELNVEGLDLECIIKGLKDKTGSYYKYPCMRGCGQSQMSIH